MPTAADIRGTVFKNGAAVLMARIVGLDGDAVVTSDLVDVHYSVFEVNLSDPDSLTTIAGHDNVELTVGDVFYDTLQTGEPWSVDAVGYNFLHQIDVATNEAFLSAGASYQVRYEVTPVTGQKVVFRFLVRCI
jgi:hypothetical protein